MGVRENKVEKYLDKQVEKKLKGITRKWVSPGRDGVPDRILFLYNEFASTTLLVEVKTIDGELTSIQKREHEKLRDYCVVATVWGEEGVDKLIEDLLVHGYLIEEEYK